MEKIISKHPFKAETATFIHESDPKRFELDVQSLANRLRCGEIVTSVENTEGGLIVNLSHWKNFEIISDNPKSPYYKSDFDQIEGLLCKDSNELSRAIIELNRKLPSKEDL